jgi:hypothetical protein
LLYENVSRLQDLIRQKSTLVQDQKRQSLSQTWHSSRTLSSSRRHDVVPVKAKRTPPPPPEPLSTTSGYMERVKMLAGQVRRKLQEVRPISHQSRLFETLHHAPPCSSSTIPPRSIVSVQSSTSPPRELLRQSFKHLKLPSQLVVLPDSDESFLEETRRSITQMRERSIPDVSKVVERKRAALAALRLRPKPIHK